MRTVKRLYVADIEYLAFVLAREIMSFNEPIPDFSTRFPNILESCLITPFQEFQKKSLYHGLIQKASMLFYLMIKNHPFQNGNKRIAVTTLLTFLCENNKWLRVNNQVLLEFSMMVAGSDRKIKDEMISIIEKFIKEYIIDYNDEP